MSDDVDVPRPIVHDSGTERLARHGFGLDESDAPENNPDDPFYRQWDKVVNGKTDEGEVPNE